MAKDFYLVVTAGGSGTRMGADRPKQFLSFDGVPVLRRTIERFAEAWPGVRVVTVLPKGWMDWWRTYCLEKNFSIPQILVAGGITRFHSVRNALARVPEGAVVAVHDGVRPFVTVPFLRALASRMEDGRRALIPVLPSTDTLVALHPGEDGPEPIAGRTVDRSEIWRVQTPQLFLSEDLRAAYGQPYDPGFTDDGSVASAYGIPLTFCEGERFNIKLTTPEDMVLARAIREAEDTAPIS